MTNAFAVHKISDRYHVANAVKIIAYGVDRPTAIDVLLESVDGLTVADASKILDSPSEPSVWRATFAAATANELRSLADALETTATDDDVAAVNERLDSAMQRIAEIQAGIERDQQRAALRSQIAELEAEIERRLPLVQKEIIGHWPNEHDIRFSGYSVDVVRQLMLTHSPLGQELQQLRAQL